MVAFLLASIVALQEPAASDDLAELRGVVLSIDDGDVFASRAKLAQAMDFLYDHGVDVVMPIAWSHDAPLWPSDVAQAAGLAEVDPRVVDPKFKSRDALLEVVVEGHRAGLEVVPILDLTGAKTAKLESALIHELVTLHEVDGVAIEAGKGDIATQNARFAALKADVSKVDRAVKLAVLGSADQAAGARSWLNANVCDVFVPRLAARDVEAWKKAVDALVSPLADKALLTRIVPFFTLADGGWRATAEYALAALAHDRARGLKGEILSSFSALRAGEAALADEIARETFYGVALVPWRDGVNWRTRSEVCKPNAGQGRWEWRTDSSGVAVLELAGNQTGSASWTLAVIEKGDYGLYVWISPDADLGKRAVFQVARRTGARSTVVDPTVPKNRGWVFVGSVPMQRRESREVLLMLAEETDPAKVNVAGPLVAILHRRQAPK